MTRVSYMRVCCTVVLCALALEARLAHAQSTPLNTTLTLSNTINAISIVMNPVSPAPGQVVHLVAESPLLDLGNSLITWTGNGKTIAAGEGNTTADITLAADGTPITVVVDAVDPFWGEATKTTTVGPAQIDILFDGNTYVPAFYPGRSLASPGTTLRLEALVHFTNTSGSPVAPENLIYTWKRNGTLIAGTSGLGRSTASIAAPSLYGTDIISVDVRSADGTISATKSIVVPSIETILMLYEDNPLFGIMFHQALPKNSATAESEATFAAVPYFADAQSADDPALQYAWSVNDSPIPGSASQPSELTVHSTGAGVAAISLSLLHASNLYLNAHSAWTVQFIPAPTILDH